MLPPNPNKKSARQLLTELQPGKDVKMYDPNNPGFLMTQCVRVGDVYYLAGPQFTIFTTYHLLLPADMRPASEWELDGLFEAARKEGDTEAAVVKLTNDFLRDHGARPDDLVFICQNLDDTINTLAGLYAAFRG